MCGVLQICVMTAIVAAVAVVVTGQQHDPQEMYATCKNQANATDEEVAEFQKSQGIPSTRNGKCLLACIFKNTGVLTKDGKYDGKAVLDLAKQTYMKSPEKFDKAKKVVDSCRKEVANVKDYCEVAVIVANCTMIKSNELGLESG